MVGWTDGRTDGQTESGTEGETDGRTEGRRDGGMDYIFNLFSETAKRLRSFFPSRCPDKVMKSSEQF